MITNTDITKLKEVFATKKDLERFATKKDLERFATKEELADVKVELGEVHDKVDVLTEKFSTFEVKLDRIVEGLEEERLENAAGATILNRHSRQIEALARGTKV